MNDTIIKLICAGVGCLIGMRIRGKIEESRKKDILSTLHAGNAIIWVEDDISTRIMEVSEEEELEILRNRDAAK